MKRTKSITAYHSIETGNHEECSPIPTAERDRLTVLASQGDEDAKQKLVKSCIKFAVNQAKKYYVSNPDIPFMDFVQEACLGLLEAVSKTNISRGRFLTCAGFYVGKNLKNLYMDRYIVRLPRNTRWNGKKKRSKAINDAIRIVKNQQVDIKNVEIQSEEIEDDLDKAFLIEKLKCILNELDQFDKRVIEIRYLSSSYVVPLRDVAKRLGKNLKSIELAEIRALKRMKEIVKERDIA